MNKPDAAPITLNSHDGEVSAVDWYVSLESHSVGNQILYFIHKLLISFIRESSLAGLHTKQES